MSRDGSGFVFLEWRNVFRAVQHNFVRSNIGLVACRAVCSLRDTDVVAYNEPPSPTVFNQLASVALWGATLLALERVGLISRKPGLQAIALLALLATAGAAVLVSMLVGPLPASLAVSSLGMVLAAAAVAAGACAVTEGSTSDEVLMTMYWAWLIAGVLSCTIGAIQVFMPDLPDGEWVARSGLAGRAVGNVRQPNHLSSLLLWSAVAVVPLAHSRRLPVGAAAALFGCMVFGLVLSGSRTGMLGVLVLAGWGLLDARLGRAARALLLSAPLWFALLWILMSWWARETAATFGAATHLAGADPSSSRFGIWSNTLALVAAHPWNGVGFGEFNFAWTLSPFPDRPVAFFDHTHNLPLQLAVELGVPAATAVLVGLAWVLWCAGRRAFNAEAHNGVALRAAFIMVLMMVMHSQLEYPLWYAYFLLPTAWMWGSCLAASAPKPSQATARWAGWLGGALVCGSVLAGFDYLRIAQIFAPRDNAPPLAERIADGQRSLFFAHHADYAAVTTVDDPSTVPDGFKRAPHYLLDTRLMIAWSRALAAQGELDRARHLAQRLLEFRNPASDEFFAPCKEGASPPPFQCQPPSRVVDWREFR